MMPTPVCIISVLWTAEGLYLLANSGSSATNTFNCGFGGKVTFTGCAFISGSSTGTWNLLWSGGHGHRYTDTR